jgi:imidazolonepropionase-like amidohydrolase
MLEAGFTTIRDVGNAGNYADSDLRRAIEEGIIPGPTVINAGRIISPYGGQFPGILQPERRDLGMPEYLYADTRDELKKAIRENILYGAKVIKIVVDDQPYIYSVEDIKYIVDEAAKAGLKVAAHAWSNAGTRNAAEAGVASIEHGYRITDETLEIAKRNKVVLVPTDWTEEILQEMGFSDPKKSHARGIDRLRRAYKMGVTLAFGSDVSIPLASQTRGDVALSMIESFTEAGIPARVILQAMTTNAAQLLAVEKERGLIKPGFAADLIATGENPLDNIHTLKKVRFVMKEGKIIKHVK